MSLTGQVLRVLAALCKQTDGGSDRPPAWLHNLGADPNVGIQIAGERRRGTARIVEPSEDGYTRSRKRVNAHNRDRCTAREQQTMRPIRVIAVNPDR